MGILSAVNHILLLSLSGFCDLSFVRVTRGVLLFTSIFGLFMKEKFCCQHPYDDLYAPEMQDSTQYSTTEKQAKH